MIEGVMIKKKISHNKETLLRKTNAVEIEGI
jgi:hypothetical protein